MDNHMESTGDPLDRYRRELEAVGYSPRTVTAKVRAVELAAAHADVSPEDLTRDDLLAWIGDRARADWTRIKYLGHVSAFFQWLGRPDPTEDIRRPRQPIGVPKPVSEHGLASMLGVAGDRERAWVVLGAYAGFRSFETAKVCAEDLEQHTDGSWRLYVEGKGGQMAWVPVPDVVVDELRPWVQLRPRGRLWPEATPAAVQEAIRRVARKAGVRCSSHQLRHRYGTAVYTAERDLLLTQQLMRHRSPTTTAGYAMVAGDRHASVVASLPGAQGVVDGRPRLTLVRGS